MSIQLLPLFPPALTSPAKRPPLLTAKSDNPRRFPVARDEIRDGTWEIAFKDRWRCRPMPDEDEDATS